MTSWYITESGAGFADGGNVVRFPRHPDELEGPVVCDCLVPDTGGRYGGCARCHRMTRDAMVRSYRRECQRLQRVIADAVAALHADEDRIDVADRLEREAAPF